MLSIALGALACLTATSLCGALLFARFLSHATAERPRPVLFDRFDHPWLLAQIDRELSGFGQPGEPLTPGASAELDRLLHRIELHNEAKEIAADVRRRFPFFLVGLMIAHAGLTVVAGVWLQSWRHAVPAEILASGVGSYAAWSLARRWYAADSKDLATHATFIEFAESVERAAQKTRSMVVGVGLMRKGDANRALSRYFAPAIPLFDDLGTLTPVWLTSLALLCDGNLPTAVDIATCGLRERQMDGFGYLTRALAHAALGHDDLAHQDMAAGVAFGPVTETELVSRALSHVHLARSAAMDLAEPRALHLEGAMASLQLAAVCVRRQRWCEAEETLVSYSHRETMAAAGLLLAGIYAQMGQRQTVLVQLRRVVECSANQELKQLAEDWRTGIENRTPLRRFGQRLLQESGIRAR